ncbi:MAG: class I SAM-dependent RNA methyltransferase [Candidatus Omnitrophica bacterium]|nr:class I SAM-dependent RNA methyltransferase [Candidatus Omnitrophota bacterium]
MADIKAIPLCPAFGNCGGCCYQDISYEEELKIKDGKIRELLCAKGLVDPQLISPIEPSPQIYHYRNRLNLQLKKYKSTGNIEVGFTPVEGRGVVEVTQCPIAVEPVSQFLSSLKKEAIPKLPPKYRMANLSVRAGDEGKVLWGGIGKLSTRLKPENYFWTEINGCRIFYSLDTFFQPNTSILPRLFEVLRSFEVWVKKPVFFDLYGGVGFFTLCVADLVDQAILIEECVASIQVARYNVDYHHLTNCEVIEGRVEKHLSAALKKYTGQVKVAMIDPPRGGLSVQSRQMLIEAGFDQIFYLSCNPETLARDLNDLTPHGWQIQKVIPFDFFPRTKHIETLVNLKFGGH